MENNSLWMNVFMIAPWIIPIGCLIAWGVNSGRDAKASEEVREIVARQETGRESELEYLIKVSNTKVKFSLSQSAFLKSSSILVQRLEDKEVRDAFARFIVNFDTRGEGAMALYRQMLAQMASQLHTIPQAEKPAITLFLLGVARCFYASNRPNGLLTIYDEQAIQNDISSIMG